MSKKLDQKTIDDNNDAITEAYNAINHPNKFKAFVTVKYLGDYTPPLTFKTEAGITLDDYNKGMWIDFDGFEDRYYLQYNVNYQVFKFYEEFIEIECETKSADKIRITITPN